MNLKILILILLGIIFSSCAGNYVYQENEFNNSKEFESSAKTDDKEIDTVGYIDENNIDINVDIKDKEKKENISVVRLNSRYLYLDNSNSESEFLTRLKIIDDKGIEYCNFEGNVNIKGKKVMKIDFKCFKELENKKVYTVVMITDRGVFSSDISALIINPSTGAKLTVERLEGNVIYVKNSADEEKIIDRVKISGKEDKSEHCILEEDVILQPLSLINVKVDCFKNMIVGDIYSIVLFTQNGVYSAEQINRGKFDIDSEKISIERLDGSGVYIKNYGEIISLIEEVYVKKKINDKEFVEYCKFEELYYLQSNEVSLVEGFKCSNDLIMSEVYTVIVKTRNDNSFSSEQIYRGETGEFGRNYTTNLNFDLEIKDVSKAEFHERGFMSKICVNGDYSINDLNEKNIWNENLIPSTYVVGGNLKEGENSVTGSIEDLKFGSCMEYGWTMTQDLYEDYKNSGSFKVYLDYNDQIQELNENNNFFKYESEGKMNYSCYDSDDGYDYYEKGYVDEYKRGKTYDACGYDGKLWERVCNNNPYNFNPPEFLKSVTFECPYGCEDGVCLNESSIENYTLTDEFDFWEDQSSHNIDIVGKTMKGAYACDENMGVISYNYEENEIDNSHRISSCTQGDGTISLDFDVNQNTEKVKFEIKEGVGYRDFGIKIDGIDYGIFKTGNTCAFKEFIFDTPINITYDSKINVMFYDGKPYSCEGDPQLTYIKVYSAE